ncbi:hypothetical protein QF036_002391 [Arthrobacter globiformis]|nr:hypothetical protein [Arthrobacter globiformis]
MRGAPAPQCGRGRFGPRIIEALDLVGHEGGVASGQFCLTLTVTDIATEWTVNRSVPNKARNGCSRRCSTHWAGSRSRCWGLIRTTDRSSSMTTCFAYCHAQQIAFTRSRPGNKNDGAHVEQKNWARVTCYRSRSWCARNATGQSGEETRRRAHATSTRHHKPGTRKCRVIAMNAQSNASNPQHCPSRSWPHLRIGNPTQAKTRPCDN